MQIKTTTALAVLLLATALSGCGGGGGGEGGSSSVPPQPTLPDCYLYGLDCSIYNSYISQGLSHEQASERTQTLSIRMINADAAYDRGYDGRRRHDRVLRISPLHGSHPELNGKVVDNPYGRDRSRKLQPDVRAETLDEAIRATSARDCTRVRRSSNCRNESAECTVVAY